MSPTSTYGVTVGGFTSGAVTFGAAIAGTFGVAGGRRMISTTSRSAITITTLMTTIRPIGSRFFNTADSFVSLLGASGRSGTTGAGARLIICVNSLGPAAPVFAGGAPPSVESGVEPAALKTGGAKTPGSNGEPARGEGAAGPGAGAFGGGTGVEGSGAKSGDGAPGAPPAIGDRPRIAPVAPPKGAAEA